MRHENMLIKGLESQPPLSHNASHTPARTYTILSLMYYYHLLSHWVPLLLCSVKDVLWRLTRCGTC